MRLRLISPAFRIRCSRLVLALIFIYFSFHDRFMARGKNDLILRDRLQFKTGVFQNNLLQDTLSNNTYGTANLKIIGTTTAYESAVDTGVGSPNLFFNAELQTEEFRDSGGDITFANSEWIQFGTPDLHPEGYVVVSDVLVGISSNQATAYTDTTLELDIMLIAEPVKVTKDELKEMLAQATDL